MHSPVSYRRQKGVTMETQEKLKMLVEHPEALDKKAMIFTPKEVMDATGITKGTLTNRALRMGIKRKGFYTYDEVERILTKPLKIVRSYSSAHVELLQNLLIEKFKTQPTQHAIERKLIADTEAAT